MHFENNTAGDEADMKKKATGGYSDFWSQVIELGEISPTSDR